MRTQKLLLLLVAVAATWGLTPANAQTLYTLDGTPGGPLTVDEITGPPDPAFCMYPNGPLVSSFPYAVPFICPTPGPMVMGPPPFGITGGVATNSLTDTVYVTDGIVITEYSAAGAPLNGWVQAVLGPLTGIAFDPLGGILYVTDGIMLAGILPPPAPGCMPGMPVVFPWPAFTPAPLTGLTWDPSTATLWAVDAAGMVYNMPPGVPPLPMFPIVPDPLCGLGGFGPPQGLAFDMATPGVNRPPTFYATDGVIILNVAVGGAPAPPTFYSPFTCIPVPAGPISGLGYTSHAITYGVGTDPAGMPPPAIGATGEWVSPSGPLTITLAGASMAPMTLAGLFFQLGPPFGPGAACLPIPFLGGNLLYLMPPLLGPIGPFPVIAGGLTLPAALPAGLPPGLEIEMQWVVRKGFGGYQVTEGLELTVGLP